MYFSQALGSGPGSWKKSGHSHRANLYFIVSATWRSGVEEDEASKSHAFSVRSTSDGEVWPLRFVGVV